MLRLRTSIEGEEQTFRLAGDEVRLGRGSDNDIILFDFSVSRHHALIRREEDGWVIYDQNSTNGVLLDGIRVPKGRLRLGDRLSIGTFELRVEQEPPRPVSRTSVTDKLANDLGDTEDGESAPEIANATIVRPIAEFTAEYGKVSDALSLQGAKREALEQAYASEIFGYLTRLAGLLISTDSVDEVLQRVMDIAFEALPVERGFMMLPDENGKITCQLARSRERVDFRPDQTVPVSNTMVQVVMRERVALLTYDALSDKRLSGGDSIRIHGIRAAMCAPLWSDDKIIGFMQVDSPFQVGSFNENDLDFFAALANYAAVAVERLRYAHRAEVERRLRGRLERYHSPAVIEEVMRRGETSAAHPGTWLKNAEVTVLFADLVGFTTFTETAPPEHVTEMLEGFFNFCVEAIFEAGGTLDKFIGDCVMAFFGAPMPHNDHALRGVRAAIEMRRALDQWNADRSNQGLPMLASRIAINSGPVVVGDIGSHRRVDYTILGTTVNIASRLEQFAAGPGDIVIGPETNRLLAGRIETESMGEMQLKGLQQKITPYRVVR